MPSPAALGPRVRDHFRTSTYGALRSLHIGGRQALAWTHGRKLRCHACRAHHTDKPADLLLSAAPFHLATHCHREPGRYGRIYNGAPGMARHIFDFAHDRESDNTSA